MIGILLSASPVHGQLSTIKVVDQNGAHVTGASACFGTQYDPVAYGQGVTDQWGNAQFQAALPEGPASLYVIAHKDGRGAAVLRQITTVPAPLALIVEVALPNHTGGPNCIAGGSAVTPVSFLQSIVVDPGATLLAGHIFEIQLILDRPPPAPVPVVLEASNPRLVSLPDRVTFEKGEQKKVVKGQVGRDVTHAEYVRLEAHLERNPAVSVQTRILIGGTGEEKTDRM